MARRRIKKKFTYTFLIFVLIVGLIIFVLSNKKETVIQINTSDDAVSTTTTQSKKNDFDITVVGDLLFENPLYVSHDNGYDLNNYFSNVKDTFLNDDITLGNMEVVIGNDNLQVSGDGYNFCAPSYIGKLVSSLDFQVLSTANNHAFDRGLDGINSTIDFFKNNSNIKTVGTYENDDDRNTQRIVEINGVKFGFTAYTYGTNQSVAKNNRNQIGLYRDPDSKSMTDEYREKLTKEITDLRNNVDVLVVMMHWGTEFTFTPNDEQKEMAEFLNSLGVDIIYGSHSHSIQPVDIIGDDKKTLVFYSLGNFVSADDDIARTPAGNETFDNAYQFGLMGKINVSYVDNKLTFNSIKTNIVVNYFDSNMSNWKLVLLDDYTEDLEKSHYRYSKGLTKKFITDTYNNVIDSKYR